MAGEQAACRLSRQVQGGDLNAIYRREKDFLKSLSLDEMASSGDFEPPP
jgi:hypothetical protein